MIGAGDLVAQEIDRIQRGLRTCRECLGEFEPQADERECPPCDARLRPRCTCGCEELATLVADLYVDGEHDCRAPWLNIEHALEAVDSTDPDVGRVDVRPLDPLAEIIKAAPCWCEMGVEWCPTHGLRC
jgi:hypothetical protein